MSGTSIPREDMENSSCIAIARGQQVRLVLCELHELLIGDRAVRRQLEVRQDRCRASFEICDLLCAARQFVKRIAKTQWRPLEYAVVLFLARSNIKIQILFIRTPCREIYYKSDTISILQDEAGIRLLPWGPVM